MLVNIELKVYCEDKDIETILEKILNIDEVELLYQLVD